MERFSRRLRLIGAGFGGLLLCTSYSAQAGGFSESFKNFILGAEAHASSQPAVLLPAGSRSSSCMQCHDGSAGPHVNMKPVGTPMQFRGHMSIDHPIGMDYGQQARKYPESYVAPATLDKRIVFEDGKVTCISCHQVRYQASSLETLTQASTNLQRCNVGDGYTTGSKQTGLCMSCHSM